jgi:peptide/nickel transport system substrate-binding protein
MHIRRRAFLVSALNTATVALLASCGTSVPAPSTPAPPPPAATAQPNAAQPTPAAAATGAAPAATTPPTTTAAATIKPSTMLIVADRSSTDKGILDPAYISDTPSRRMGRAVYDTLVDVDPQGNIVPVLAESWDTPDPQTYVLHLKQGVKFTDGTDFDAAAVKFNIDRHLDPQTASKQIGTLLSVASVEAVDTHTVKFNLKAPYAAFLSTFFDRVGFIASPTAVQQWGNKDYGIHPVGAGPFQMVDYESEQQYVLQRNPNYWDKGRPYLDGITFKDIPVDATRETELRSGGAHMAEDLPLQDVERMKTMTEFKLNEQSGARFYFARWNLDDPALGSNDAFRQALNWLIDRAAIHNAVFFNTGTIGYDPFTPGTPFYDPNYAPFTRDLDKAKALLDQANLPSPVKFTLYPDPDTVGQKLTQVFQANFADIGINVDLQTEDDATHQQRLTTTNWVLDLRTTSWFGYRPDPAQYLGTLWSSKSTYYPVGKLQDPESDQLIAAGEAESDPTNRHQIYRQLADRLNQVGSSCFFQLGADFKGIAPAVQGFVSMPDSIVRYKNISLQ